LAEVRAGRKLELVEVSKQTGISLKFLKALETGNFEALPPDVYILGFLKQLSQVYNLEQGILIGQYRKEKIISSNIKSQGSPSASKIKYALERLVITPKSLSIFLGALFVVISISYIVWQVLSINRAPNLEVVQPKNNELIMGSLVEIRGITQPGASVEVNGKEVFVESDGRFSIQIGLNPGPKELVITANNKFGKIVSKTINIIGHSTTKVQELILGITATEAAEIEYVLDGDLKQTRELASGETISLKALEKIDLSAKNGGAVLVSVNGRQAERLGGEGENIESVSFFAESGTINNR